MFHIFDKSFVLVRHIYWIFRLLCGGWLGKYACFRMKWHLWPSTFVESLWSTASHTAMHVALHPRPRARARSLASGRQARWLA